jgi:hypothetical protein
MNSIDIIIKLFSNPQYPQLYPQRDEHGIAPQTRALAFCMHVCGIQKLFDKEDFHLLVFRLAVAHRVLDMPDNFFGKDFLFDFQFDGMWYRLTTDDLTAHIGLHITPYPEAETPFDDWQKNIHPMWTNAFHIAHFAKLAIPGLEKLPQDRSVINIHSLSEAPSSSTIENATILAKNIVKEMPDKYFSLFSQSHQQQLIAIKEYLIFAKSPLPLSFSWADLKEVTQNKIKEHFSRLYNVVH